MMDDSSRVTTRQPIPTEGDDVSYVDSDIHAQAFCCLPHCCDNGADPRWYYPWDKGLARMMGLYCLWCGLGLVFPCCMCVPSCRDIACMTDQGLWRGSVCGKYICVEEEPPASKTDN
ncbi:hypothetical protein KP79_PYT18193 [Mizuhopecten yessoensis]|uniref:Uncharacterized protein n=1 Tax=Mizuhopecten yessoensis TaxID=6573 RepID=A0A210QPP0_MIZYE|nr:hypothetical protein KP79_PYT18193 [Mizuhopecten yessoensis]